MKAFSDQILGDFMAQEWNKTEANETIVDRMLEEDLIRDIDLIKQILKPHLLGKNKILYSKPQTAESITRQLSSMVN